FARLGRVRLTAWRIRSRRSTAAAAVSTSRFRRLLLHALRMHDAAPARWKGQDQAAGKHKKSQRCGSHEPTSIGGDTVESYHTPFTEARGLRSGAPSRKRRTISNFTS